MEPVISPWVFYLMPVCEKFANLMFLAAILSVFGLVFTVGIAIDGCLDDDELRVLKRVSVVLVVILLISTILVVLLPNEETITKMLIAQNVTVDRVEDATDLIATVYSDIMNLFEGSGGNG